ncbi:MAG: hypothetical protein ACI4KG_02855 [Oscillospiraceae bacterium]
MNMIPAEELPGVKKKSFSMYFGGSEIWFEHLDGIYSYTDIAVEKLENDYLTFKRPSMPSLIAINLDETEASDKLISAIAEKLMNGGKRFTRVVFVGTDRAAKRKIKSALAQAAFALDFINDFEKAKEWLASENFI